MWFMWRTRKELPSSWLNSLGKGYSWQRKDYACNGQAGLRRMFKFITVLFSFNARTVLYHDITLLARTTGDRNCCSVLHWSTLKPSALHKSLCFMNHLLPKTWEINMSPPLVPLHNLACFTSRTGLDDQQTPFLPEWKIRAFLLVLRH